MVGRTRINIMNLLNMNIMSKRLLVLVLVVTVIGPCVCEAVRIRAAPVPSSLPPAFELPASYDPLVPVNVVY